MSLSDHKFNEETQKYVCFKCGKEYSKAGIGSHFWRKHTKDGQKFDPNKGYHANAGTRKAWNKGLTKETDERVKKYGETFKKKT